MGFNDLLGRSDSRIVQTPAKRLALFHIAPARESHKAHENRMFIVLSICGKSRLVA